jgi:hypothetical protein
LGLRLSTEKSSPGEGGMNLAIKEQLIEKIEQASESTLQEVFDFLLFLEFKESQKADLEISRLSEASLAEDWLTPAEDKAWEHL